MELSSPLHGHDEVRKRRREVVAIVSIGLLFLVLTWIQYKLFDISQALPFVHAVFFFGLVNFNIILFLLLFFLIFRNVVKVFSEKQGGLIGSSLKSKLIAAFVAFSFIPTLLMFLVSVFYINNSFDKWFSEKMAGVLKNSLEVTNAYYLNAKRKNYHFASRIAAQIEKVPRVRQEELANLQNLYSVDAVEYYPSLFSERLVARAQDEALQRLPKVSLEFLRKGIEQESESSTIHHFGEGNLVRVIVPARHRGRLGAIVVSSYVPLSLISKMDDITSAYEDFRDVNPLEYPLKSIYLIILVLMALVIFLGASWFGFYLARQLSVPLEELGDATERLAKGDFHYVKAASGSREIDRLIQSFNSMIATLQETLSRLDEHTRYVEVVLSSVSTGVISVDDQFRITMINKRAAQLLEIESEKFVGKQASEVLRSPESGGITDLLVHQPIDKGQIHRAAQIQVREREVPLQMTLSVLADERGKTLGRVLVFDDLTPMMNAQRAAAWTEVARRIAHEIKNPLTPIRLAAQRLNNKFAGEIPDPAFSECVRMIIDQVDDLKGLVNEFSNFARMPEVQLRLADLNQVIHESLVLYRESKPSISFAFTADSTLPQFLFDPDQIRRAVGNLIDNALAAIKNVASPCIEIQTHLEKDLQIAKLTISDNGIGIPKALRNRIFEPYVTTKEHGTGLGLAIVRRTVEDHNGFIRVQPNSSQGSTFIIELPMRSATSSLSIGEVNV